MKHPGFDWAISPTRDWRTPAEDAWHWVAYLKDGTRINGFAPTEVDARVCASGALAFDRL